MHVRGVVSALFLALALSGCAGAQRTVVPSAASEGTAAASFPTPPRPPLSIPRRPDFIDSIPQAPELSGSRRIQAAHPSFFAGEIPLSNNVYYLQLPNGNIFGYYSYLSDPRYIYHFDLGYEYVADAGDGNGLYLYDFTSSHWWYTSRTFSFPYLYDFGAAATLYYYPDTRNPQHYTTNPRYFYNFRQNQVVTSPTPQGTSCTMTTARVPLGMRGFTATAEPLAQRRAPRSSNGGVVPDQLYVTYRAAAGTRAVASVERGISAVRSVEVGPRNGDMLRAITLVPGSDLAAVTASLRSDPNVVDVAPVHFRSLASDPAAGANDGYTNNVDQWYLYKANVVKNAGGSGAWNLSLGCSTVSIAIIDTGVDLSGNNTNDFILDFAESVVNGVTTVGAAAAQDTNGHGTNVAGLATAIANNGYGFAGVGFSVHLQAYRIFPPATATSDAQTASTADEVTAINDAVAHGAAVISLSLGSPQYQGADVGEQTAIANAISKGVVVVAAAGNEYPGTGSNVPDYPAGYPGVIAVGASGVTNTAPNNYASITGEIVASYSNSGPTLLAPGGDASGDLPTPTDILHWIEGYSTTTAAYPPDRCSNGGTPPVCRALFNGTSQATPQVSGVVGMMEAYHGGSRTLSASQVTSILTSTADTIGAPPARQGAGRVNAGRAVAAAHP